MVDFSFIVSLYVSDLPNVTISTRSRCAGRGVAGVQVLVPVRVTVRVLVLDGRTVPWWIFFQFFLVLSQP